MPAPGMCPPAETCLEQPPETNWEERTSLTDQCPPPEEDTSRRWRTGGQEPPGPQHLPGDPTAKDPRLMAWRHDTVPDHEHCSDTDHEVCSPLLPSRIPPSDAHLPSPCYHCYSKYSHQSWKDSLSLSIHSKTSEILPKYRCQCRSKISILEEVLSWRRTSCDAKSLDTKVLDSAHTNTRPKFAETVHHSTAPHCLSFKYILLILSLVPLLVSASESPDRECCDGPSYKLEPGAGRGQEASFPRYNYPPPEVPDFPEYGPHEQMPPRVPGYGPGVYPPSTSGSPGCLLARTLCLEDSACNQILQVIPRVCGLELVTCSTPTVTKCQAALRTLQSFPFFKPTCLCKEPRVDPDCNQFKDFLIDHPCLNAKYKETDPYPVDALPTCHHAEDVCNNDPTCRNKVQTFPNSCPVQRGQCVMKDVQKCHNSWQRLRQSPIFGCFCPSNLAQKSRCDEVFERVNGNDCIGG